MGFGGNKAFPWACTPCEPQGLTAGFRVGIATVHCYIREAVVLWAALALTLEQAMQTVRKKAYVILDGTLLPLDRIAADRPYCSRKKKHHGMNAVRVPQSVLVP